MREREAYKKEEGEKKEERKKKKFSDVMELEIQYCVHKSSPFCSFICTFKKYYSKDLFHH
jgi:hypothetical protein